MAALAAANRKVTEHVMPAQGDAILDIDTTVTTVHGEQEGAEVGYNPRYPGPRSYQPFLAFEGVSRAAVHVQLRSGKTPDAREKVAFYRQAKAQLSEGRTLRFVRADRSFGSEEFLAKLAGDDVGYTVKLRMTAGLYARIHRGVHWQRLHSDETSHVEVGSVLLRADTWCRPRRVVLIRTRRADDPQLSLFDEYAWDYEAIVTNLDWHGEDIRCTCENHIKELKYGLPLRPRPRTVFGPTRPTCG